MNIRRGSIDSHVYFARAEPEDGTHVSDKRGTLGHSMNRRNGEETERNEKWDNGFFIV